MRTLSRLAVRTSLLTLSLLAACGGDATGPDESPFPSVAGTYALTGAFDAVPASVAGTITLSQPGRESGQLSGTSSLTLPGLSTDILSGMNDANVDEQGNITFSVGSRGSSGTTWRFAGRLNGNAIAGTHVLGDGVTNFTGTFTAVRQ